MSRRRVDILVALVAITLVVAGWSNSRTTFESAYADEATCKECHQKAWADDEQLEAQASLAALAALNEGESLSSMSEEPGDSVYAHIFAKVRFYSGTKYNCSAFNACHEFNQPGECDQFHWTTGCSAGDLAVLGDSVASLLAAGATADVRALLGANSNSVAYDESDGTIVVRNCELKAVRRIAVPVKFRATMTVT